MSLAWVVLIASGLLETVWASALEASGHFHRLWPSLLFAGALACSMAGLSYAMGHIPLGTAYGVWVGIGAIGTAVYGMAALGDPATAARLLCLLLIVAGVVGLGFLR
ncbi:ligand-binding protein SH3 [Streptomyces abyssalis]|uniref:Ligand-binding protein SH3 n=1 Tax=Streptomyces abyssalis TaxID=933944 RepID=A0A1E7JPJ0_9ACTN|nr:SMR family transporter [Streptomyces abyssalis]OEU90178.1 ligand-binding protein SH3 [Streptomyces abyssalis]OEU94912.1 ligand-binding protein SH3 [Streptomyces abyssalis]OEV28770.1 ligand-binding protein SH3 [Streptomyces nanshensis]